MVFKTQNFYPFEDGPPTTPNVRKRGVLGSNVLYLDPAPKPISVSLCVLGGGGTHMNDSPSMRARELRPAA